MFVRTDSFMEEEAGDELLLLDLANGLLHRLNPTARYVWDMLAEISSLDELVNRYSQQFSLEEEHASNDVKAIVRQFEGAKLVSKLPVGD